jgi:hypothetical protein
MDIDLVLGAGSLLGTFAGGVAARGFGAPAGTIRNLTTGIHTSPVLPAAPVGLRRSRTCTTIDRPLKKKGALPARGSPLILNRLSLTAVWAFKKCAFDTVVDKLKPKAGEGLEEIGANRFARSSICP